MKLKDSTYNVLKWVAIIVMPALATLITVVFKVWNIPFGDEIAQTVTAIATFLGAILMVSNAQYHNAQHHEQFDTSDLNADVPED